MIDRILIPRRAHLVNCLLSHLTAAVLLLHMVCGCCWHHLAATNCHDRHTSAVEAAHCHDHHAPADHESDHSNHDRHPSHPCSDIRCMFTAAGNSRIQSAPELSGLVKTFCLAVHCDSLGTSSHFGTHYPDKSATAAPSLRLHLLHQLLLI